MALDYSLDFWYLWLIAGVAVLQQHGADDAQAMIQEAFDERARELEADMRTARLQFEADS